MWLDLDTIPALFEAPDLDARTARQCGLRVTRADSGTFLRARPATKPAAPPTPLESLQTRRRPDIDEQWSLVRSLTALPGMPQPFDVKMCRCCQLPFPICPEVGLPERDFCVAKCRELTNWKQKQAPDRVRGEADVKKSRPGKAVVVRDLFEGVTT